MIKSWPNSGRRSPLAYESEQQMLGAHPVVIQHPSFFLSAHYHQARLVGEINQHPVVDGHLDPPESAEAGRSRMKPPPASPAEAGHAKTGSPLRGCPALIRLRMTTSPARLVTQLRDGGQLERHCYAGAVRPGHHAHPAGHAPGQPQAMIFLVRPRACGVLD